MFINIILIDSEAKEYNKKPTENSNHMFTSQSFIYNFNS